MNRWFQIGISCNGFLLPLTTVHRNPEAWETYTLGTQEMSPGVPLRRRTGVEWESQFRSASLVFGELLRRTPLREPVVGNPGNGPTFVSNPSEGISKHDESVIALRAEFVLKPGNEEDVRRDIDLILANSFGRDRQFLQALVLVSEMESRLVTVITFWQASGFTEARERRVVRLRQKLQPYLDKSLRVHTFSAHVLDAKSSSSATRAAALAEDSFSSSAKEFSTAVA